MEIWTFATQKGGAGKTTLVSNLAVAAKEAKENVLIIDLDPQESVSKWWKRREAETPQLVKLKPEELKEGLDLAKKQGFSHVFIDTAGHDTLEHNEAILSASFCLIPCQPSIADIEAVYPTVSLMKRIGKNFCFVLTRCPAVGQDVVSAREGLSAHGLVARPYTIERKAYKHAFAMGEGVTEYDVKDKAANEISELFKWTKNKVRRLSAP